MEEILGQKLTAKETRKYSGRYNLVSVQGTNEYVELILVHERTGNECVISMREQAYFAFPYDEARYEVKGGQLHASV